MKPSNQLKVNSLTQDMVFHPNLLISKLPALKNLFIYHNNDFNTQGNKKLQVLVLTIHR